MPDYTMKPLSMEGGGLTFKAPRVAATTTSARSDELYIHVNVYFIMLHYPHP